VCGDERVSQLRTGTFLATDKTVPYGGEQAVNQCDAVAVTFMRSRVCVCEREEKEAMGKGERVSEGFGGDDVLTKKEEIRKTNQFCLGNFCAKAGRIGTTVIYIFLPFLSLA
jgi:hypothetical protein